MEFLAEEKWNKEKYASPLSPSSVFPEFFSYGTHTFFATPVPFPLSFFTFIKMSLAFNASRFYIFFKFSHFQVLFHPRQPYSNQDFNKTRVF